MPGMGRSTGPRTSPYRERMRLLVGTLAALAAGGPNDHSSWTSGKGGQVRDLAGPGEAIGRHPPPASQGSASSGRGLTRTSRPKCADDLADERPD